MDLASVADVCGRLHAWAGQRVSESLRPSAPLSLALPRAPGCSYLKLTAPVPQPPLAALIYLPDMCFLVCFLSPARHGRWYWAVLTALLHSCQMNQSLLRAPRPRLVPTVFSTSINSFGRRLVLFLPFIKKRKAHLKQLCQPLWQGDLQQWRIVSFLEWY